VFSIGEFSRITGCRSKRYGFITSKASLFQARSVRTATIGTMIRLMLNEHEPLLCCAT